MRRLAVIKPLVDHLKGDSTLAENTASGKNIFVLSDYQGITEDNQFSPAIWIIPLTSSPAVATVRNSDCRTMMSLKLFVAAVVNNVGDLRRGFGWEHSSIPSSYLGAYPEASDFEDLIRDSILKFNREYFAKNMRATFSPLTLVENPKPDLHNGHLILPQIYEVQYSF